jgi:membrane-bound lytic murein transglycosylase D
VVLLVVSLAACGHLRGTEAPERLPTPRLVDPGRPSNAPPERHAEEFADLFERMRRGFALPRVEDDSVDRQLDWYVRHSGHLDRALRRGTRYLYYIVDALEIRGMPRELALLPVLESAFDPFATSRCRASGLWQFIPSTGRLYGLKSTWWYDGRRDVLDATGAALDHLQALHDGFEGDWLLALAAYNTGPRNVERAVARNQQHGRATDFFHLDLPLETRGYVPALLALARLVEEPGAFGLELPAIPNQPYFASVEIEDQVDLGVVADRAGIPRDELRLLNPGFNRWATPPDGPHRLLAPAAAAERVGHALAELPPARRLRLDHHRVVRGDTLGGIARRYGISVAALRAANRIEGDLIRRGQDLLIPLSHQATVGARRNSLPDANRLLRPAPIETTAPVEAEPAG